MIDSPRSSPFLLLGTNDRMYGSEITDRQTDGLQQLIGFRKRRTECLKVPQVLNVSELIYYLREESWLNEMCAYDDMRDVSRMKQAQTQHLRFKLQASCVYRLFFGFRR